MSDKFILNWRDGSKKEISGNDIADAMNKAGFGAGCLPALDFWEKIKEQPEQENSEPPLWKWRDFPL